MKHFTVTTPDGKVHERSSDQDYTHAVIVNYGAAWQVFRWATSQRRAEQTQAEHFYLKTFVPEAMQVVAVEVAA